MMSLFVFTTTQHKIITHRNNSRKATMNPEKTHSGQTLAARVSIFTSRAFGLGALTPADLSMPSHCHFSAPKALLSFRFRLHVLLLIVGCPSPFINYSARAVVPEQGSQHCKDQIAILTIFVATPK
jgi:hypothetical protein